jgi:hypothetical protein
MLVMPGRVTLLGLSRWAGKGGSDRTGQRFFSTVIPWATRFWGCFRQHGYRPGEVYLLVGEAVVATKAGTPPHGRDRFCASLEGKPGPGLAFFPLSLGSTPQRRAFPLRIEQGVRSDAEKAAPKAKVAAKKPPAAAPGMRRPGRPKGSQNKPPADGTRTPACVRITGLLDALLHRLTGVVSWTSLGLDGHCGHHHALQMAQEHHLQLISKRRCDAALYFPDAGP